MPQVITAAGMRLLEQEAVEGGLTYSALMYTAGTKAACVFESLYSPRDCRTVLILCGNGNNGGDGFVIAKKLACDGYTVKVLLTAGMPKTSLAAEAFATMSSRDIPVNLLEEQEEEETFRGVSHVIDAVFGIGFRGCLPKVFGIWFDHIAALELPVFAVDIPSGLHADSGFADPHTLKATHTVTFTAHKPALVMPSCFPITGAVTVADVGIEKSLCRAKEVHFSQIEEADVYACFMPRPADGHKGTFGRLLSVCGSYGMVGAALLSGKAALRCGVGLLHMALPRSVYSLAAGALWEPVYHPLPETAEGSLSQNALPVLSKLAAQKQAVLVGCGLSQHEETEQTLCRWLPTVASPLVIDADGLNCLCRHTDIWKAITAPMVITPHPAEAARLLSTTVEAVERDRIAAVTQLAKLTNGVCVLKGHHTLICDTDGTVYCNTTGCVGMATGGSGDVLSGMIASFLAQGMSPLQAAISGVCIHGLAGEAASARLGYTAMLPSDMLAELPTLLSHFEKRE